MMTISGSTTLFEKGFSSMKNEKTCLRIRLTNETLDDILQITIKVTEFKDFDSMAYDQLWLDTKGKRYIRRHSAPKRKGENEDAKAKTNVLKFINVNIM